MKFKKEKERKNKIHKKEKKIEIKKYEKYKDASNPEVSTYI